ncbi:unnamed protein product [Thlaspi arvense]|uniref:Uncharacterized protein n=1 Tax=Thlaspi arvense TaxID=13288 RepID=A0AAU9T2D8_THLAR|nr:unnamed protein product [Thlaspi arvense]
MSLNSLTSMTKKRIFLRVYISFIFLFFQSYAIVQTDQPDGWIEVVTKIMYPKVKVVDEVGNCKQKGSCLNSNYLQPRASENNQEQELKIYVAKIPKIYIPSVVLSESESTEITKHIRGADLEVKQKTKASPILRPRAVVSSPDNDEIIGSINRIEERKAKKGFKSNGHISNRASQRKNIDTNVKISHRIVPKQSGVKL